MNQAALDAFAALDDEAKSGVLEKYMLYYGPLPTPVAPPADLAPVDPQS